MARPRPGLLCSARYTMTASSCQNSPYWSYGPNAVFRFQGTHAVGHFNCHLALYFLSSRRRGSGRRGGHRCPRATSDAGAAAARAARGAAEAAAGKAERGPGRRMEWRTLFHPDSGWRLYSTAVRLCAARLSRLLGRRRPGEYVRDPPREVRFHGLDTACFAPTHGVFRPREGGVLRCGEWTGVFRPREGGVVRCGEWTEGA